MERGTQRFAYKLQGTGKGASPPCLGEREGPVLSNAEGDKDPSHTQHIEGGRVGKTHVSLQAERSRTSLPDY